MNVEIEGRNNKGPPSSVYLLPQNGPFCEPGRFYLWPRVHRTPRSYSAPTVNNRKRKLHSL